MKLHQLLNNLIPWEEKNNTDPVILGITDDSRAVKPGYLFLAVPGLIADGRKFIDQAIHQGAVAILYDISALDADAHLDMDAHEAWQKNLSTPCSIPVIPCQQLDKLRGIIAAKFYEDPSLKMKVIGVTGTNGKTSCTHFIAQALAFNQKCCAIAGTLGNGFLPQLQKSALTTPSALNLQAQLANFLAAGAEFTAMEVSSHSLDQDRVRGVHFDIAVLTQLSRDHLDYHGSIENYAAAKSKLFACPSLTAAVLNYDDMLGQRLIEQHKNHLNIVTYSMEGKAHSSLPSVIAKNIKIIALGFQLEVATPWGEGELSIPLLGKFNISNILAVLAVLGLLEIPFKTILTALSHLKPVVGRMQQFGGGSEPTVIVDYAHTPDALDKALLALKCHKPRELWCVFGCGGDRDPGKRSLMAQVVESYANHIIVTNDNPRHEKPEKIIADICQGFTDQQKIIIQLDRAEAIAYAISHAKAGDMILIAGKGHETVQIIGDQQLPFSDQEQVLRLLR
jgi:UDP-N-acetylmuramoyl-L-alanyl-D-glutamate--2,6-diaminopimelate ligase